MKTNLLREVAGIVMLLLCTTSYGQLDKPKLPSIISPSPTVANLMTFEEVPVDNYTGQPGISIPLVKKDLGHGLTMPIELKYSTLGVRLQSRSGWTGTSWTLEAGGVVSRTVRGVADEAKKPTLSDPDQTGTGIYHLPQYWDFSSLTPYEKSEYLWNVNGTSKDRFDCEPDLYQFSVLGKSGRFIVEKSGSTLVPVILSRDEKMVISLVYDSDFKISSFTVTDANGCKYVFSAIETTTSDTDSSTHPFSDTPLSPDLAHPHSEMTTAWYLTQIKSNQDVVLATFTYSSSTESYDAPPNVTTYKFVNEQAMDGFLKNGYNPNVLKPRQSISYNHISVETKKMSSISFLDGTSVTFTNSSPGAHPETGGVYLVNMKYKKPSGGTLKEFVFTYSTTSSNNRLWLTSVSENGMNYALEYYEKDQLPAFDTNGEASDDWGYNKTFFEGYSGGIFNGFYPDRIKRGLLTKIVYPTGGSKHFIFEQHTYSFKGDTQITDFSKNPMNFTNDVTSARIKGKTNGAAAKQIIIVGGVPTEISTMPQITTTHEQVVGITLSGPYSCPFSAINDYDLQFYTMSGMTKIQVARIPLKKYSVPHEFQVILPAGTFFYTLVSTYSAPTGPPLNDPNCPGVPPGDFTTNINLQYQIINSPQAQYLLGGGVRIREILFKETASELGNKRRIVYTYFEPDPLIPVFAEDGLFTVSMMSSGVIDSRTDNLLKKYNYAHQVRLFSGELNTSSTFAVHGVAYTVSTKELNVELSKGNYVGYRNVKVRERGVGMGVTNGLTLYSYTSAFDYPSPASAFEYPFRPSQNIDHKRGLLTGTKIYDSDAKLLAETTNSYAFEQELVTVQHTLSEASCGWRQFYDDYFHYYNELAQGAPECGLGGCVSGGYDNCSTTAPYSLLHNDVYAGWSKLISSVKKEYFYTGSTANSIQTTTTYDYNLENYQVKEEIKAIAEGGGLNEYKTLTEYPIGGYTGSLFTGTGEAAAISSLASKNIVNVPIVKTFLKNSVPLQRVVNKYYSSGLLKEIETSKGDTATPEDRIIYQSYDAYGNPTEVSTAGGMPITYIWDGVAPIAEIKNMTLAQFNTATNPGGDPYVIYDWSTMRSMPQFANAMLTHLTYVHGEGVQTITDPKGYTINFFYDSLQRLLYTTDQQGNIVSANKYNYRP